MFGVAKDFLLQVESGSAKNIERGWELELIEKGWEFFAREIH